MSRSLLVGSVAVAVAVTLAGCVAPEPTPTATQSPVATPSPDPIVDTGPAPRIDATCDDLVESAALQAFVGLEVDALSLEAPADRLTPDTAAGEQLGGISCTWTNGLPPDPFQGPDPAAQTVLLRILPEGIEQAIAYVDVYELRDATYGEHVQGPRCLGPAYGMDRGYCELFGVIGQTWIELTIDGIVVDAETSADDLVARFRTVFDPMISRLASATPGERWEPEHPAAISPVDCDVLTPTAEIVGVTAIPELRVGPQWDGPRVGQYWYGLGATGAGRCSLAMSFSDASLGQIGILPAGAWGFERFADSWLRAGGTHVAIPGVEEGDSIVRCDDAASDCIIDLSVAGNWIRVTVYPAPAPEYERGTPASYYESARAGAEQIAAIVAQRVATAS